ncbi:ATP-binding protein, partial [Candidatus Parcubacteria bacterium]
MNTIFDLCTPRVDVLQGDLKEEIFAARLRDVIEDRADPIYQNPLKFFDNTYPTQGLCTLLNEALGRLTGVQPAANPILRLETAFGGGKTHNLIALYHVAAGHTTPDMVKDIVSPDRVPGPGMIDVAGVVGSDLDPSTGLLHPDNTRTFTLWGELAYQLRGQSGYRLAHESDQNRSAPGTGLFEELIGNRPTLIMLDEIARYMRVAQTIPSATGKSDLAEQTVAFLMALLEFAASRANVVVVLTLAASDDAFGRETDHLRQQLDEAHRVSARQEMVITPTGETELAAIVTHRLFERIDRERARQVLEAYGRQYKIWDRQRVILPARALRAGYLDEMLHDYPFHPEFLNTLSHKTSTIPNFQKTRGALRLLALVIRQLWDSQPANTYLIHPHHLDLQHPQIVSDLTSRLERPAFQQVIEADIVSAKTGSRAHAQIVDEVWEQTGKPPYARRTATTVLLHSLTQGIATGLDPADLRLAVLSPGDDPILVDRALERLDETCWFFEWDGHRYRFKTEPSLNKIITDEMGMIGRTGAKHELDRRLRQVWKSGTFKTVYFPQEPGDVDDDAGPPKLLILHYDAAHMSTDDSQPPDLVRNLFKYSGTANAYRTYTNNLIFLVPDSDLIENMVTQAQRYLAIQRILNDVDRLQEFTEEQRRKLKNMAESAELDVRVAITRTYRHLFFPSHEVPTAWNNLAHELLPAQDQGEVRKDQSEVVLRALKLQGKVLTGDDRPKSAQYVRARTWDTNQTFMSTEDLRKAFARRIQLPILLDPNQLKKTVKNGIETGVWVYYNSREGLGYDSASPPPAIQIDDEMILYLPQEAEKRRLPIKGRTPPPAPTQTTGVGATGTPEERCPVCGNPASACTCGQDLDLRPPLKGRG